MASVLHLLYNNVCKCMRLFCNQSVLCDGELCTGVVANQAATVKSKSQFGGPATGVDASEAKG